MATTGTWPPSPRTATITSAGDGWIDDELFWPAFLFHVGAARSAPGAFDVDLADLDSYLDRFADPAQWPVFTAQVGAGTLYLVVCNLTDDPGIDWVLDDAARASVQEAGAAAGGHQAGSGLAWELLPDEPVHLLISLPAFGDRDPPGGVSERIAVALRAIGAGSAVRQLADDLLAHRAGVLQQEDRATRLAERLSGGRRSAWTTNRAARPDSQRSSAMTP